MLAKANTSTGSRVSDYDLVRHVGSPLHSSATKLRAMSMRISTPPQTRLLQLTDRQLPLP